MTEKKWANLRVLAKELVFLYVMSQSEARNQALVLFRLLLRGDLAGSNVSESKTISAIGAIGGAVVGGLIGAKTEELIMQDKASEFVIQPDDGQPFTLIQANKEKLKKVSE